MNESRVILGILVIVLAFTLGHPALVAIQIIAGAALTVLGIVRLVEEFKNNKGE